MSSPYLPPPAGNLCVASQDPSDVHVYGLSNTSSYGMGTDSNLHALFGGHVALTQQVFTDDTQKQLGRYQVCQAQRQSSAVLLPVDRPLTYCTQSQQQCANGSQPLCYPNQPSCTSCICGPQPIVYGQQYAIQLVDPGSGNTASTTPFPFQAPLWFQMNGAGSPGQLIPTKTPVGGWIVHSAMNIPDGQPVHHNDLVQIYINDPVHNQMLALDCTSAPVYKFMPLMFTSQQPSTGTLFRITSIYQNTTLLFQGTHFALTSVIGPDRCPTEPSVVNVTALTPQAWWLTNAPTSTSATPATFALLHAGDGAPQYTSTLPQGCSKIGDCDAGLVCSPQTKQCVTQCTLPFLKSPDGLSCICPQNALPSADGQSCQCCGNLHFDTTSQSCICPSNVMHWDPTQKTCVCPSDMVMNAAQNGCICPFPKIVDPQNPQNCICPASMIMQNDQCVCQGNMILNADGTGCTCPSNTTWNPTTKTCDCNPSYVRDPKTQQCVCPANQTTGPNGTCVCKNNLQPVPGHPDQCQCPIPLVMQGDQCVCPGSTRLSADGKSCTPSNPSPTNVSLWLIIGLIAAAVISLVVLRQRKH